MQVRLTAAFFQHKFSNNHVFLKAAANAGKPLNICDIYEVEYVEGRMYPYRAIVSFDTFVWGDTMGSTHWHGILPLIEEEFEIVYEG